MTDQPQLTVADGTSDPNILSTGLRLIDLGLPIIPVGANKDPKGVIQWRSGAQDYVTEAMSAEQWTDWAGKPHVHGIAVLGSDVYGTVVLDVERPGMDEPMIQAALQALPETCQQATLKGGRHAYLIVEGDHPGGNRRLAQHPPSVGTTEPVLLAEYRGHAGYAVIVGPGRPPLPDAFAPHRVTREEFDQIVGMIETAGTYHPQTPTRQPYAHADGTGGGTGGIVSTAVATGALSPLAVLPDGWEVTGTDRDGRVYIRRPGATSETSGNVLGHSVVIHSSSVDWAVPGEAMTPAETLARSMFGGDFHAAMQWVEGVALDRFRFGVVPDSEHWAEAKDVLQAIVDERDATRRQRQAPVPLQVNVPPGANFGVQAAYSQTDHATLADRFLQEHADRIRYIVKTRQFSVYDERTGLWSDGWEATSGTGDGFDRLLKHAMMRYAREQAERVERGFLAALPQPPSDDDRRRAREAALKVEKHMRSTPERNNVAKAAQAEASGLPGMAVSSEAFDAQPYLIADPLGVIDLRTGERGDFDPALLLTRALPVAYDPGASCPEFERFLLEAQPMTAEREYLQRREGSTLIGRQLEHAFHIDIGDGRNGKGVLGEVVTSVLGPLGGVAPSSLLMVSRNDKHEEEIARLRGLRRVWIDEARDARSFDGARVKNMSGGALRSARFMRGNSFTYTPSDTIILSTNQMPKFEGSDGALVARLRILPWEVSFQGREDLGLAQRIVDNEAAGVIRWLVEGAQEYLRIGLSAPESVLVATQHAAATHDLVAQWAESALEVADASMAVSTLDMFDDFNKWLRAEAPGTAPTWTHHKFGLDLLKFFKSRPEFEHVVNLKRPKVPHRRVEAGRRGAGYGGLVLIAPRLDVQAPL